MRGGTGGYPRGGNQSEEGREDIPVATRSAISLELAERVPSAAAAAACPFRHDFDSDWFPPR
eukprot:590456-Pyramimonas_sp.AAC.1